MPAYPFDKCKECGLNRVTVCDCEFQDSTCPNNHQWYRCQSGKRHEGEYDEDSPCSCVENDDGKKVFDVNELDFSSDNGGDQDHSRDKPHHSRDKQDNFRDKPHHSRDKPHHSKDKPHHSKDKPDTSRDKPHHSRDKPDSSRDKPHHSRDKPDKPHHSRDKPDTSRDKPHHSKDKPDKPHRTRDKTDTSRDKPHRTRDKKPSDRINVIGSRSSRKDEGMCHMGSGGAGKDKTKPKKDKHLGEFEQQIQKQVRAQIKNQLKEQYKAQEEEDRSSDNNYRKSKSRRS